MSVKYLTVELVLKLHENVIRQFGGSLGVRDKGLLESAVFRPQASFDTQDLYPDIYSKAAALMESLCKNHPFVDGNKRIAFTATVVFLDINGIKTVFDVDKAEAFVLKLASGQATFTGIEEFLKGAKR